MPSGGPARPAGGQGRGNDGDAQQRFLFYLSALMAKMAQADGNADMTEFRAASLAFSRLGLTREQCQYCATIFTRELGAAATTDAAMLCAALQDYTLELREILYEILWNIACADGYLSGNEKDLLRNIAYWLHLRPGLYDWYFHQRVSRARQGSNADSSGQERRAAPVTGLDLGDAYGILGCPSTATPDELKAAYHAKAKRFHPDLLRAQGLPEAMIGEATKKMTEINAAWDVIKRERGL